MMRRSVLVPRGGKEVFLAFIPARGGSKSIPMKNISRVGGRPLIYWTAKACSDSRRLGKVFVATDSEVIRQCVEDLSLPRVEAISRSRASATDEASTEMALLEFAERYHFDYVVLVQPTSPLVTSDDIDGAIDKLVSSGADSVLSVVRSRRFHWAEAKEFVRPMNYDPERRPRRQEWDGQLVENGALYITSRERLLSSRCRLSGRIAAYEMPPSTDIEVDTPLDLILVEALLHEVRLTREVPAARVRGLKLLCLDVDGTLTDGGMYYSESGELLKRFQTRDAFGMRLIQERGMSLAVVSGEDSPIVQSRARKLGIEEVHVGVVDKEALLDRVLRKHGLTWRQVGFVGDDLNDLSVMRRAGFSACPADAAPEIIREAMYVCARSGGQGAVREVCDVIVRALDSSADQGVRKIGHHLEQEARTSESHGSIRSKGASGREGGQE